MAGGRTMGMRRGMNGLVLQVQQALACDPHAGNLYVFRGSRGDLEANTVMQLAACKEVPYS